MFMRLSIKVTTLLVCAAFALAAVPYKGALAGSSSSTMTVSAFVPSKCTITVPRNGRGRAPMFINVNCAALISREAPVFSRVPRPRGADLIALFRAGTSPFIKGPGLSSEAFLATPSALETLAPGAPAGTVLWTITF